MHYPFSTLCDENGLRRQKMDVFAVLEATLFLKDGKHLHSTHMFTHVHNLKLNFYFCDERAME